MTENQPEINETDGLQALLKELREGIFASEFATEITLQERFNSFDQYVAGRFGSVNRVLEQMQAEMHELKQFLRVLVLEQEILKKNKAESFAKLSEQERTELVEDVFLRYPFAAQIGVVVAHSKGNASSEIDCESRLPICHAACCFLRVPLTSEEVQEKHFPFDLTDPFYMQRDNKGFCSYFAEKKCLTYGTHPSFCREYDCRGDKRIWEDFEKHIPSSLVQKIASLKQDKECV